MTRQEILDRIRQVARERLELDAPLRPDAHLLRDLELDSLRQLSFVIELENEFAICFEPEDEGGLETVDDVVDVVMQRLELAATAS
ncbi:MAG TPA: acyl carrier protein [Myxococcota bacterium]|jgi:acyl carrier protein|nr:acyl carrier protein [Myxococcota bacterium]